MQSHGMGASLQSCGYWLLPFRASRMLLLALLLLASVVMLTRMQFFGRLQLPGSPGTLLIEETKQEREKADVGVQQELEKKEVKGAEQEQARTRRGEEQDEEQAHPCPPSGNLISAERAGRLGNVMFYYATLLGASHMLGRPAWLLPEMADTLTAYFQQLSTPVLPRGCHYNWTKVKVENLVKDASKNGKEDHLIINYPTAVPVFHPLRQKVLKEFTFRSELRAHADRRLNDLARQNNLTSPTFIGVHVRRTDYNAWLAKFVHGRLTGADYLRRALALMRSRHPGALFVVASDDLAWCRQHLHDPDVTLVGDGVQTRPGDDLALLAACNHSVVTHGTFGFWAAYLAGGEVVKPTGYGTSQTGVEGNVRRAHLNWTWIPAFSNAAT